MANFNTTINLQPDYGVTKTSKPVKRVIRYADGYEHRLIFGMPNFQNPKTYSLTYENITEAQSDLIESFLDDRAIDSASFDFTPPNDVQGKYVCDNWTKRIPFPNRATINVTFRQVFEPS
ncbi:phage tail protein [Hyphomonas sp.]|uniref:phage tail protein n=1 Tax=Hyphomonas sp. TaxID=87 RepID=UPI000C8B2CA9|nr:phage tail protein [Hyphomonas sp.]MAL46835.1 hypothetical protein [Hyphomonas sp.]